MSLVDPYRMSEETNKLLRRVIDALTTNLPTELIELKRFR